MEITEEKLEIFVEELKQTHKFCNDSITTLEDMTFMMRFRLERIEFVLEHLAKVSKKAKESPSLPPQSRPSPQPAQPSGQ